MDKVYYVLMNRFPNYNIRRLHPPRSICETVKVAVPSETFGTIELFFNDGIPDTLSSFWAGEGRNNLSLERICINDNNIFRDIADIIDIRNMVKEGYVFKEEELIPKRGFER